MLDCKERVSYYDSRLTLLELLNDFAALDTVGAQAKSFAHFEFHVILKISP